MVRHPHGQVTDLQPMIIYLPKALERRWSDFELLFRAQKGQFSGMIEVAFFKPKIFRNFGLIWEILGNFVNVWYFEPFRVLWMNLGHSGLFFGFIRQFWYILSFSKISTE